MKTSRNWTKCGRYILTSLACATPVLWLSTLHAAAMCYKERFQDRGEEVYDAATGLSWKKQPQPGLFTWDAAKNQCASPWRLPTAAELQSIVDDTKSNPAIDSIFGTQALDNFWSSSPKPDSAPARAWFVNFKSGYSSTYFLSTTYQVRCVR